jgi:hypothetical protein
MQRLSAFLLTNVNVLGSCDVSAIPLDSPQFACRQNNFGCEFCQRIVRDAPDHMKDMTDHQSLFRSIDGGVHEIFDLEALKDYIDHGGDVNIQNEYGDTFLHIAIRVGKVEVVRSLLECSAVVDKKNQMMDTPIQVTT